MAMLFLMPTVAAVAVTAGAAGPLFADGFERGDLSAWGTAVGMTVERDPVATGSFAAHAASDGASPAFAVAAFGDQASSVSLTLSFDPLSVADRMSLVKLQSSQTGNVLTVGVRSDGRIYRYVPGSDGFDAAIASLDLGTWHQLGVAANLADGTISVTLDGIRLPELSSSTPMRGSTVDGIMIGDRSLGRSFESVFDDVSVRDASAPPPASGSFQVKAAGDIACDPADPDFQGGSGTANACRASETAALLGGADVVLPLGDEQYWTGSLTDFQQSYARSWGTYMARSRPVPGNHEYESADASGYYAYFGAQAGPASRGYYSYDLGGWHVVALNSECAIVGCGPGSAQYAWLRDDLASNPAACVLAYWHRPRFSSGANGDAAKVAPFWDLLYAAGTDIVLNGHDHDYERFAPQDPQGRATSDGIREFVVGSGGRELGNLGPPAPNSVVRNDVTFGVLDLTLGEGAYRWTFQPAGGGTFIDSGSGTC